MAHAHGLIFRQPHGLIFRQQEVAPPADQQGQCHRYTCMVSTDTKDMTYCQNLKCPNHTALLTESQTGTKTDTEANTQPDTEAKG